MTDTTKKTLRSNFDQGTTRWAVRRAQWRALGIPPEDLEKPKVAIVNTSSELSICFAHLDGIVAELKAAIRAAGGVPFEIRTTAPSDFVTGAARGGRYLMPARELVAHDIEVSVEGAQLDGMICLASCDKTAPAQMMAMARLDIPALILACGYQRSGHINGTALDIEDVFEGVGEYLSGKITLATLTAMTDRAITGPGVCAGMGTANSMHIMAEALGLALPGTTPVAAASEALRHNTQRAGRRIVEMIAEDLRPSSILSRGAFRNALAVSLAVSGSVNVLRHLAAVAAEAGLELDLYEMISELGERVPQLAGVKPCGPHRIEDLEAAGGTRAVMQALAPLLDLSCLGASGQCLTDELQAAPSAPPHPALGSLDSPFRHGPSVMVLRGTLAPEGAILKAGGSSAPERFCGPAQVFSSQEEALDALTGNEIAPGSVVVLRGLGARGGPGVASASWFVAALSGSGLASQVCVVTDGQLSGLNHGLVVGQVCPEAADLGPLAAVRDGDRISLDLGARRIDLDLAPEVIARRISEAPQLRQTEPKGWLALYQRNVGPLPKGATTGAPINFSDSSE